MKRAQRTLRFNESMIREMTRLAIEHDAINLSQGFPDFAPPEAIVNAAIASIQDGVNQYTVTWGYPPLRSILADHYRSELGWDVDPDVHVTVTCGVTEGISAAVLALLDPGDEFIIIEPAHENFRPAIILADAVPVAVALEAPDYRLSPEALEAVYTEKTRGILLNTPHNPTGRVFDQDEVAAVIEFVTRHDLVLITDEIYDRILYDGRRHISPGSLPGLVERTVTIGGLGKSFAVTGWRLGYVIAPEELAAAIRPVHDYLTICAPTPLQAGAVAALQLPESYFEKQREEYQERRELMMSILDELGFEAICPEGAYYTLANYANIDAPQADLPAKQFAHWLTTEIGVAAVAGPNFYSLPGYGESTVRFAFPKKIETLEQVRERLARFGG